VLGIHCGIYKSSHNISNMLYLNLPPLSFSFTLLPPRTNSLVHWFFVLFFSLHFINLCLNLHFFPPANFGFSLSYSSRSLRCIISYIFEISLFCFVLISCS
jgi:hypothetical protein